KSLSCWGIGVSRVMAKLSALKLDTKKEIEGVWVPYRDTGVELKIASLNNPEYERMSRSLTSKFRRTRGREQARSLTSWEQLRLIIPAVARFILLDWKNLEDEGEDGKVVPIPYSEKKAI